MRNIELYPASNDPRLPKWARGILPAPPENVDEPTLLCACADRILSLFELTGDPDLNDRLHDATNDLAALDSHVMDQTSIVYWLHVIGWILTDTTFSIPGSQVKPLVDDYHENCLRMALSPIRGVKGMTIPTAEF